MAEDVKDTSDALREVAKHLADFNKKTSTATDMANKSVASLESSLVANGKALQKAISSGQGSLQKSLKDDRSRIQDQLAAAISSADKASAIEEGHLASIKKTFEKLGVYGEDLAAIQEKTLSDLANVNSDIESTRLAIINKENEIAQAEEQKNKADYDRFVAEKKALEESLTDLNETSKNLKEGFEDIKNTTGVGGEDESAVQTDPNSTPEWALRLNEGLSLQNLLTKEGLANLGEKLSGFGAKIGDVLGSLPGADAAKGFLDAITGLAKTIFMTIGGFTAFNGFLDGMQKATEWFDGETGFKELIASGIAGMLDAFGVAGEDGPKALAEKIVSVFNWMQEKIEWMFEGVKQTFLGIVGVIESFGTAIDQFKNGDIIGGIKTLLTDVLGGLIGSINGGAIAAFALLAPKLTLSIFTWGVTTLVPKMVEMMSTGILPSLTTIKTKIMAGMSTVVTSAGTFFTSIGTFFTATVAPLLVAAAPFVAAAALVALAIKGIYEGITEAIDVFKGTGSVVESLKAGLSTMIGTIMGFVPDLLKNIVSWAAEKLGFENFSDKLDSFSFTDAITDAFRNVLNWFEKFPLTLKKGILSFLNTLPFMKGKFDENIAAVNEAIAEKDAKAARTTQLIEDKRAEEEEVALAKEEKQEQPATDPGLETSSVLAPVDIQPQLKAVVDGLGRIEQVAKQIKDSLSAEVANTQTGGTALMANTSNVTNNRNTTAVSSSFRHRNIGATQGMFGSAYRPLVSP